MDLPVTARYFDCNATTPLSESARAAWLHATSAHWHNPSSLYREAATARAMLEEAREKISAWMGSEPSRVIFTAGATESNNAVFAWAAHEFPGRTAAVSAIEHPSVAQPARWHFRGRLTVAETSPDGVAAASTITKLLASGEPPALVSVHAANNETGILQPWEEIAALCRDCGVLFHCDAAQWVGKLPAAALGACDFVTGSAHKFGGPKGVGFLMVRERSRFAGQRGGPQENGRRAGTENLPGVAAMAAAWEERERDMANHSPAGRDAFERRLLDALPQLRIVGAASPRLWNTSLILMPEFPNTRWIARLSDLGFAVSTGAACSTGEGASTVLAAMGFPAADMRRVLRISGGWHHAPAHWMQLADAFLTAGEDLRSGIAARPKLTL